MDDEEKTMHAVRIKLSQLHAQTNTARGELLGMAAGIDALISLDPEFDKPQVAKRVVGLTRDQGLKMIELGQAMRRIADLTEPIIDDVLKGDVT